MVVCSVVGNVGVNEGMVVRMARVKNRQGFRF